jgi:hypothetical protein
VPVDVDELQAHKFLESLAVRYSHLKKNAETLVLK